MIEVLALGGLITYIGYAMYKDSSTKKYSAYYEHTDGTLELRYVDTYDAEKYRSITESEFSVATNPDKNAHLRLRGIIGLRFEVHGGGVDWCSVISPPSPASSPSLR